MENKAIIACTRNRCGKISLLCDLRRESSSRLEGSFAPSIGAASLYGYGFYARPTRMAWPNTSAKLLTDALAREQALPSSKCLRWRHGIKYLVSNCLASRRCLLWRRARHRRHREIRRVARRRRSRRMTACALAGQAAIIAVNRWHEIGIIVEAEMKRKYARRNGIIRQAACARREGNRAPPPVVGRPTSCALVEMLKQRRRWRRRPQNAYDISAREASRGAVARVMPSSPSRIAVCPGAVSGR